MDTRWKKSKRVVAFISWAAGSLLLVGSLLLFLAEGILHGNVARRLTEVFESNGDYQNTAEFTESMADWLNTFLAMSAEKPSEDGEAQDPEDYGEKASENGPSEEVGLEFRAYEKGASGDGNTVYAETVNSASTDGNPNILYRVERKGQLLYTNDESLKMYDDPSFSLPEDGYNYVLYFNGEKAVAYKDGREVNLYGNGYYYSDKSPFYAPGYKNFPADPSIRDTKICMVAPKVPTTMIRRDYAENGSIYYDNTLHSIQERLNADIWWYTALFSITILGALLFLTGLTLHKDKKEADRAVAGVTGKVWYEVKLLVLLGTLYSIFMCAVFLFTEASYTVSYSYHQAGVGAHSYQASANVSTAVGVALTTDNPAASVETVEETGDYSTGPSRAAVETLFYAGGEGGLTVLFITVVLGFPVLWLFINDARYNKKPWKKSLTAGILRVFQTSLLKLPPGKRLMRRQLWVTLAVAAPGISIVALLIVAAINFPFGYDVMVTLSVAAGMGVFLILVCQILSAKRAKNIVNEMDLLADRIQAVHEGKLTEPLPADQSWELCDVFRNLDEIRRGMNLALQEQMKSERMKVELIANVSHDIKTPLTSIISYVELLKQEEGLPEHVKEYVAILESKAARLKTMVQDVFEVSKAASGELPVRMEDLDLGKLLRQTLADMAEPKDSWEPKASWEPILASEVTVKTEIPEEAVMIHADGERLYRVFQNLIQNALKYSLSGSRVFITLQSDGSLAVASVKNTSSEELPSDMDFTERFTRGDRSRSDGGSGLGLSIARSFTEACGGTFQVESIADLFVVTVSFPVAEGEAEEV